MAISSEDSITVCNTGACALCRNAQSNNVESHDIKGHNTDLQFYHRDTKRSYWQCPQCDLVQVPDTFLLSPTEEKAEYDKHDNHSDDTGYRQFLNRTLAPLLARLKPDAEGLDYGCGEGRLLSRMAAEHGIRVANYDLYYQPERSVLEAKYDFITLTEVIEHIADSQALIQQLDGLLKPAGTAAIMTKRVKNNAAFSRWHYKNDPTHIRFFSLKTFDWLSRTLGWRLEVIDDDVVFLHKPLSTTGRH